MKTLSLEALTPMPTALPYPAIVCAPESGRVGRIGLATRNRVSNAAGVWHRSCGLQARTTKKDLPFGLDRSPIQEESP